jgi:putative oxygen-independent coproporphyrinogen III oxidase
MNCAFGIYVHIPFCRRRCDYCAFATWTDRDHLADEYVAACRAEIAGLTAHGRGPATSLFFGGGTPSLLPAHLVVQLVEAVAMGPGLAEGAEVTVECNPDNVTRAKLAAYRAGGVNRLSLGAQSLVPHVLAALGRQHDPANVRAAVEAAGDEGFATSYNLDLIYGAVGESVDDWRRSVEGVLALEPSPSHVSAYALTVEPGTPLAARPERHPADDDQAAKYLLADELLGGAGLGWYEISNWARPGSECRHNQLYWSQGEYVGVGCSAHSHLKGADGGARRWWNVRTPERYIRLVGEGRGAEAAGEELDAPQSRWEALVLSLRTPAGVPLQAVPPEAFEAGLVESVPGPSGWSGPRGVLTRRGRLLANEVSVRLQLDGTGRAGDGRLDKPLQVTGGS